MLIAGYWRSHRRLYELLVDYDDRLLTLNSIWLLAIVFIPFPTSLLTRGDHLSTAAVGFYLGNMLLVMLLQLAQIWWIRRHPAMSWRDDVGPVVDVAAERNLVVVGCMLLGLALDAISPLASVMSLSLIPVALRIAQWVRARPGART
jgi:uncharacterized membrane protein